MKRQLFFAVVFCLLSFITNAQFTLTEGFESVPPSNWIITNNSNPSGTSSWFQGNIPRPFGPKVGVGYIAADVNNTSDAVVGTISDWLISPVIKIVNGASFTFYTRTATNAYPDRLEIRMSTNGASSDVGISETSVGDFTTKLCDINPTYVSTGGTTCGGGYPSRWTQYSITISGVSSCTDGRIAFRYFVENGGVLGPNSEYIGIDEFSYSSTCALPVSLISFTGMNEGEHIKLNWATSSESNSQQFDVLKSINGTQFEKIGSVNAMGFSNTITNYDLIDDHPFAGENYYQLKQIDQSGVYKLSNIIMVRKASSSKDFSAYIVENPVGNECVVSYNNLSSTKLEGRVLDIYGRTIQKIILNNLNIGAGGLKIPVSNLVPGNYIIKLTTATNTNAILRFVKR